MNNHYKSIMRILLKTLTAAALALLTIPALAQSPAFTNASFETPVLASDYGSLPGGNGWTAAGTTYLMKNSFIASNYGYAGSTAGNQVMWLSTSGGGNVSQSLTLPAGNHAITFRALHHAPRSYLNVTLGGSAIGNAHSYSNETGIWHQFTVFTGPIAAGNYTIQFNAFNADPTISYIILDDVRIITDQVQPPQFSNPGFETPVLAAGAFQGSMSGSGWSGITGCIVSAGNPMAAGGGPDGTQMGCLPNGHVIFQAVTLQPGTYSISAMTAAANDGMGTSVPFAMQMNAGTIYSATILAYDYTFKRHTSPYFTVTAAESRTFYFRNNGTGAYALLDAIRINRLVLPPEAALTAPAEGSNVDGATTVNLTATATAPQGAIARVEFYAGAALVGMVNTGAPGQTGSTYTYAWTANPAGTHSITAKAIMADGAHATSAARTIVVTAASPPPTVSLGAPAAGASFTAPANIPLVANASTPDLGASGVASVTFLNGAGTIHTVTYASQSGTTPDEYRHTWSGVAAGNYVLSAKVTRANGIEATSTAVNVTVLAPATVTLTAPASAASVTAGTQVMLSATATQANGSIGKVEFLSGASVIGTVTTGGGGHSGSSYTFSWTAPAPGAGPVQHMITARSTDGNLATASSAGVTVTVNPVVAATQVYYVHADHLGTPRAITRPSDNALVWKWENTEPFGNNAANQNPSGLGEFAYNLRHPGQYSDAETGTFYNYFRDAYDPSTGRYWQSDPIGLRGGLNTYRYAYNQPTVYFDPTGLAACSVWLTLNGAWSSPQLVNTTQVGEGQWSLLSFNTFLAQGPNLIPGLKPGGKGWLPGVPNYGVNCWAKFTVTYKDTFTRSREVQTFERCVDACQGVYFAVRSRMEEDTYSEQRDVIERKASAVFDIPGTEALAKLKCLEWIKGLK